MLCELPESFCKLTNLHTLDLFNNRLTEILSDVKHFKKLVRMDLNKNNLGLKWEEVPEMAKQTKYADRDPKWKDNWRGRKTQTHVYDLNLVYKIATVDHDNSDSEDDHEVLYNGYSNGEEMFRRAAERSLYHRIPRTPLTKDTSDSIWQSHNGPGQREVFVRRTPRGERDGFWKPFVESDDSAEVSRPDTPVSDYNPDDYYEPPIFIPKSRDSKNAVSPVPVAVGEEEDWDTECVDLPVNDGKPKEYFTNLYQHPKPMTLAEAGYEVDEHLFLPYDIHSQPVYIPEIEHASETGQFDDLDSDEEGR